LRRQARGSVRSSRWERETGKKWSESSHLQDEQLIEALAKAENPTDVARALIGAYGGLHTSLKEP
jgi:hypothetical protein